MTLGIRSKLFLMSLGLITASIAAAYAYLTPTLDRYLTERIRDDMLARLDLIDRVASTSGAPLDDRGAWDRLADDLGRRATARVTVIRRDGTVLGDSELDAAGLLRVENHASRTEVAQALELGYGASERSSTTLGKRMMYVAVPFRGEGGEVAGVVRLAMPLTQVDDAVARLQRFLGIAALVALAAAVAMSVLVASRMSRVLRLVARTARRMAAGDLESRTRAEGPGEIAAVGRALDGLAESLSATMGELRVERDLLGGILEGMREGVLVLDRAGRLALVNPALREALLLDADVVGKPLLEAIRHAGLRDLLAGARDAGEVRTAEVEVAGLRPRRLLVRAAPLSAEPRGLFAVCVDVTDLRRLEAIRRDFAANASHELRTPVAAVRAAAETLRAGAVRDPDAAARFLEIIDRNAERLHRLIEDLLDLSRLESREFRLDAEPIDAGALARRVAAAHRDRAEARRIRIDVAAPDDLPPASADRRALEQALGNLVDNAVRYCVEASTVVVRAAETGDGIRVSVQDEGPGIEATHLPRLFERFYRVDAGRSRELGGTGLGLSIVKHLVEAMGGDVSVDSRPGRGSTFSFTLPRA